MSSSSGRPRLRVALVAPPWLSVPPDGYGGIEVIVYLLARELRALGHDVTVFCREGSSGQINPVTLAPESWSRDLGGEDQAVREATYAHRVEQEVSGSGFDLVHEHSDGASVLGHVVR